MQAISSIAPAIAPIIAPLAVKIIDRYLEGQRSPLPQIIQVPVSSPCNCRCVSSVKSRNNVCETCNLSLTSTRSTDNSRLSVNKTYRSSSTSECYEKEGSTRDNSHSIRRLSDSVCTSVPDNIHRQNRCKCSCSTCNLILKSTSNIDDTKYSVNRSHSSSSNEFYEKQSLRKMNSHKSQKLHSNVHTSGTDHILSQQNTLVMLQKHLEQAGVCSPSSKNINSSNIKDMNTKCDGKPKRANISPNLKKSPGVAWSSAKLKRNDQLINSSDFEVTKVKHNSAGKKLIIAEKQSAASCSERHKKSSNCHCKRSSCC
ncbi:uncharacterized protein LOC105695476 [Orussus abietinus]|uniref:uncharacterized protein LOC105695476 n=1 Tax=Orussus abietinus TaxID=222816 RepID=UPI000625FF50|nr:uncharacterized protein LOC105695476 [Orussus abietinus]